MSEPVGLPSIDEHQSPPPSSIDPHELEFQRLLHGTDDDDTASEPPVPTRAQSTPLTSSSRSSSNTGHPIRLSRVRSAMPFESLASLQPRRRRRRRRMSHGPTLTRAASLLEDIHLPAMPVLPSQQYSVSDAINAVGMGRFQWLVFTITGLIFGAYAMEIMLVAFLLPVLQREWHISRTASTMIPLSAICGSFFGAFALSLCADKFGRRRVIIGGVFGTAIAAVISAFAVNIWQESVARFFVGFFAKINVVALTLFAELVPTAQSGKLLMLQSIFWSVGLMLSITLAWICLTYYDWRVYIQISTIPLWIAAVLAACWMPESPHYLMVAGEYDACVAVLRRMSEVNGRALPAGTLTGDATRVDRMRRGNVCQMLRESVLLSSLLLLLTYVCYQCDYFGVLFVSVRYFAKLDSIYALHHELYWEMMLTTCSEVLAIVVALYLIDVGRKYTMNVCAALFALCTYLLVIVDLEYRREVGLCALFLARMLIAIVGMGAGVYFLEYYPTAIRATALGLAVSLSMPFKFAAIVVAESMHTMLAMYIFATCGLVAFVASLLLPIDHPKSWGIRDTW